MEEDITILTAFLLSNIPEIITQEEFDEVKQAIEKLIKGYREKEEIIEKLNKNTLDFSNTVVKDFIPKSKVKERIEKLKNGIKNDMQNCNKVKDANWKLAIQRSMAQKIETKKVLQELMEDK